MNIKYTKFLSSVLIACPIAAPAVSEASYWNYDDTQLGKSWYYGLSTEETKSAEASNNYVTSLPEERPNGSLEEGFFVGTSYVEGNYANKANNNSFIFTGGKVGRVAVGCAGVLLQGIQAIGLRCDNATADDNKLIVTDAEVAGANFWPIAAGATAGGYKTATANGNRLELNGCRVSGLVSGVVVYGCDNSQATNNRLIIRGGTYSEDGYGNGGRITACLIDSLSTASKYGVVTATNNSVELYVGADGKSPQFSDTTLISGLYYLRGGQGQLWFCFNGGQQPAIQRC